MANLYYHLIVPEVWESWKDKASYTPDSLKSEGFIHLSLHRQVLGTAERFFKNANELLLLVIDGSKLTAPLKMEKADGDEFPHLYGSLNQNAIVAVQQLRRDQQKFVFDAQ